MSRTPSTQTEWTEQNLQNLSFDKEFGVFAVEMLGYDGTSLRRIAVDATGALKVS